MTMRNSNILFILTLIIFNASQIAFGSPQPKPGGGPFGILSGLEGAIKGTIDQAKSTVDFTTNTVDGMLTTVFHGAQCPDPKPTKHRPNGCVEFLTCGINDKHGWNPAHVKLEQLKVISGEEAIKKHSFKECKPFLHHFQKMAKKHNIPEIVPMSFALQESTCNPHCKGENGEIGMMQLTPENCKQFGVQPHEAWDVEMNIELGIKQFKMYIEQFHGNVIFAIGGYNGWHPGLTKQSATSMKYGCFAQQNLDYIDSMVNGWFRGEDGNSKAFETFNNLKRCGKSEK